MNDHPGLCGEASKKSQRCRVQSFQVGKETHMLGGWVSESHSVVSGSLRPHGLYSPWNSPGQNTGVGSLSHIQGILQTQGSNSDLPHSRQILYQLHGDRTPALKTPRSRPLYLFMCLLICSFITPLNNMVNLFFLSAMSHSSKLMEPKEVVMEPTSSWSGAKMTTWTFNCSLKGGGQSCGAEPFTCGLWALSRWTVSKRSQTVGHPAGVGENCLVWGKPHTVGDQTFQKCWVQQPFERKRDWGREGWGVSYIPINH